MADGVLSGGYATLSGDARHLARRKAILTRIGGVTLAVGALFALWIYLSISVRPWVPTPVDTWNAMMRQLWLPEFYTNLVMTWQRILIAFALSTVIGAALGIAVGLNRKIEAFFAPLLALALAVPDPVFIIFAILALGTGETAGLVALTFAITPFVANIVRGSVHARDFTLDEMVRIYRVPARQAFWVNLVPQLIPSFITAGRLSFALSWKIVLLVEALSQPHGIGAAIYHAFNTLRMRDVFALAILFTVMMQVVERLVLGQIEKRLLRWRD